MTTTAHVSSIEHSGEGDDREYAASCSCRTAYVGRLQSHAAAVAARSAHKAAVADGTWQAEQDAETSRLADLKPLHDAQRAKFDAKEAVTSCGFGVIIARQRGGDVEAARADLEVARQALRDAQDALEALTAATA